MNMYQISYCFCNVVNTWVIMIMIESFYENRILKKDKSILMGGGYYLASTLLYMIIGIPVVMLLGNLILFYLLTLQYNSIIKKRIFVALSVYLVLVIVEMIASLATGYVEFSVNVSSAYSSVLGLVIKSLLSLAVAFFVKNRTRYRQEVKIPWKYIVSLLIVPIFSLVCFLLVFTIPKVEAWKSMSIMILLLLMNCALIIIYDVIVGKFVEETKRVNFEKQLEIMGASSERLKKFKHDLKNHLYMLELLLENSKVQEGEQYIEKIKSEVLQSEGDSRSGNFVIDSILNFKAEEAKEYGILVKYKIAIPEKMGLDSYDWTIILGNILDNAIKAAKEVKGGVINLNIKYDRGRMHISLINDFLPGAEKKQLATDGEEHGIGLLNVQDVVDKYNGIMEISAKEENAIFEQQIILYM